MIIDRSHRVWFIGSLLALALAGLLYVPYALTTVTGTSGGSAVGLIYGSIGSAMMLFAGLLGARKKFPTWRVGRGTFWMRGHLWIGFLSFPFILLHAGFRMGGGPLTRTLMALFVVVFLSGIFGAILQHFIPQVMTQRVPMETIYEQIDRVLEQLVQEAGLITADVGAALEQEMIQAEEEEEKLAPVASGRTQGRPGSGAGRGRTRQRNGNDILRIATQALPDVPAEREACAGQSGGSRSPVPAAEGFGSSNPVAQIR